MKIDTVKIQSNGYLVNNYLYVPKVDRNRHYESIKKWVNDGGIIQDEFTNDELLEDTKKSKTNEINKACGNEITSGFISDALGTAHNYQSEEIDQLNLIGIVTAQEDDYFKAGVDTEGEKEDEIVVIWTYELHTIEQLMQVLKTGKEYKQSLLQKANGLKVKIADATTVNELNIISW